MFPTNSYDTGEHRVSLKNKTQRDKRERKHLYLLLDPLYYHWYFFVDDTFFKLVEEVKLEMTVLTPSALGPSVLPMLMRGRKQDHSSPWWTDQPKVVSCRDDQIFSLFKDESHQTKWVTREIYLNRTTKELGVLAHAPCGLSLPRQPVKTCITHVFLAHGHPVFRGQHTEMFSCILYFTRMFFICSNTTHTHFNWLKQYKT